MVFTCLSLHLFPYPVPAGDQGSVEHLTLWRVPLDVFVNLLSFYSEVKELKCHSIRPPQLVQCVHMYSVAWDALVFCIHQSLFKSVLIMDVFVQLKTKAKQVVLILKPQWVCTYVLGQCLKYACATLVPCELGAFHCQQSPPLCSNNHFVLYHCPEPYMAGMLWPFYVICTVWPRPCAPILQGICTAFHG